MLSSTEHALVTIDRWEEAYLKPTGGYGGVGVTRIQRKGPNRYRVSVDRLHDGRKLRAELGRSDLGKWVRRRVKAKYFLQRGLALLTLDGRKVDFRVVVQRGLAGKWEVVGIVPKVAAADGVVTNLVAGGERQSLRHSTLLAEREGKQIPVDDLRAAALTIAGVIGRRFPGTGLVGFDMGVDQNGKVWLIEFNRHRYIHYTRRYISSSKPSSLGVDLSNR